METKQLINKSINFTIKRFTELFGIILSLGAILFLLSLISYSPEDPNFIFPKNTEIKNILGFQGSYISDLFFQSFGMIAYLIPITYICTGFNIFKKKEIFFQGRIAITNPKRTPSGENAEFAAQNLDVL